MRSLRGVKTKTRAMRFPLGSNESHQAVPTNKKSQNKKWKTRPPENCTLYQLRSTHATELLLPRIIPYAGKCDRPNWAEVSTDVLKPHNQTKSSYKLKLNPIKLLKHAMVQGALRPSRDFPTLYSAVAIHREPRQKLHWNLNQEVPKVKQINKHKTSLIYPQMR